MDNLELKADFERMKVEILDKIRRANEKWQRISQEAQGDPTAEIDLVHIKLELQIAETRALKDLESMEKNKKCRGGGAGGGGGGRK